MLSNRHSRRRLDALAAKGLNPGEITQTPERAQQPLPAKDDGDPLLSAEGRRRHLGHISEMTAWRWERDFGLPPPDLVVSRRRFWRRSTIDDWIAARITAQQAVAND
jgi:predicted DNA-binding transcriptional regulator AlpA